jgi:transcription termination/antitermination protein NusA
VKKMFETEIPEVAAGIVLLHGIAREAGSRSKVSVSSTQENVDPIGSCIGQRGTRIQTVISELGGEKVDIIQYDADAAKFIANSLSPAKVSDIRLDESARVATVTVPEDQLSLAIGKGGQNVRLASKLTGWRINIREVGAGEGLRSDAVAPVTEVASEADDAAPVSENEGGAAAV